MGCGSVSGKLIKNGDCWALYCYCVWSSFIVWKSFNLTAVHARRIVNFSKFGLTQNVHNWFIPATLNAVMYSLIFCLLRLNLKFWVSIKIATTHTYVHTAALRITILWPYWTAPFTGPTTMSAFITPRTALSGTISPSVHIWVVWCGVVQVFSWT